MLFIIAFVVMGFDKGQEGVVFVGTLERAAGGDEMAAALHGVA